MSAVRRYVISCSWHWLLHDTLLDELVRDHPLDAVHVAFMNHRWLAKMSFSFGCFFRQDMAGKALSPHYLAAARFLESLGS
jgi:hypothetical protein